MQEDWPDLQDDLCQVSSSDNRNFTATIQPWHVRSDGTPVTIDDVYFTYKNIITENQRSINNFITYNDIEIQKTSDTSIEVSFARRSTDNRLFFTYHIVPRHKLMWQSFAYYRNEFAQYPIYTRCAQLRQQATDINSLVFDLNKCEDTYLWFYQLKNLHSFSEFAQDYTSTNRSIIDIYEGEQWLDGYIAQPIITHAYVTLFFNTNSEKMRIRLRRSLAWLINSQFYQSGYDKFIWKDQWIFNNFMSEGDNIEDFLTRITPDGSISIGELEESWVRVLTGNTINFLERERRHAYYIDGEPFSIEVNITVNWNYDMVGIKYGEEDKWAIGSYNKSRRAATHTIAARDIKPWLNTYIIYTKDKDKRVINIGTINIYLLDQNNNETEVKWIPESTITIIYQNTITTQKIVQHLRDIFTARGIEDFFVFIPLNNRQDMEAELSSNTYDIAIVPIDRWLKRDLSPMLKSNDSIINPSQYTNPQLTNLFEQYIQFDHDNTSIREQIVAIYTRDIPFMILGKQISHIHVKPDIYQQIFLMHTGTLFENNRRNLVYEQLVRANSVHVDIQNIWWTRAFWDFILHTINPRRQASLTQTENIDQDNAIIE